MKHNKFHLALSVHDIEATVTDYSARLGVKPSCHIKDEYALWRTEDLNVSVRQDAAVQNGQLRHLGWENNTASAFSEEVDVNGIVWERFSAHQQAEEITALWPDVAYLLD